MQKYLIDKLLLSTYALCIVLFSYSAGKSAIAQIVGIALAVLFLFRITLGGERVPLIREFVLVSLWLIIALVSAMFAIDGDLALGKIITLVKIIPLGFILYCTMVWIGSVVPTLIGILLGTVVASIVSVMRPDEYSVGNRLVGTMTNANMFGLLLLISLMACLYMLFVYRALVLRACLVAAIPFLFFVLVQTGSRKAILGAALVLMLIGGAKIRAMAARNLVAGMAALGLVAVVLFAGFYVVRESPHFERLLGLYEAVETRDIRRADASFRGRLALYGEAFSVALKHPVLGVGPDNFRATKEDRLLGREVGTYSHSNYMEVLVSTGILGFVCYFAIYVSMLFRLFWRRGAFERPADKELYLFASVLFVLYVAYDFAMVSYAEKVSWLILATAFAGIQIVGQRRGTADGSKGNANDMGMCRSGWHRNGSAEAMRTPIGKQGQGT